MKRAPSISPTKSRASKGLKALSLLTSGTLTKADNTNTSTPPTAQPEAILEPTPAIYSRRLRTEDVPLMDEIMMLHLAFKCEMVGASHRQGDYLLHADPSPAWVGGANRS